MPKDLRASLHERFAGWLERVAADRIDEQEEILAYHLEQAHRYRLELGPAATGPGPSASARGCACSPPLGVRPNEGTTQPR